MQDIIRQWQDGDITPMQALRALCNEYGETASELEAHEAQQKQLRAHIERIIEREGAQDMPGFGRLSIIGAGVTSRYDTKALDDLVIRLMQVGEMDIAAQIAACKRETVRGAFLKVEREKR
jgi:hypothetical protein